MSQLTTKVMGGCNACGATGVQRCSKCRLVAYCGRSCQAQDWASHKGLCKSLCRANDKLFGTDGADAKADKENMEPPKKASKEIRKEEKAGSMFCGMGCANLSTTYTIAAAVAALKPQLEPCAELHPLRVALLGARGWVEGVVDFDVLHKMLMRVLPGLQSVCFQLVGPEAYLGDRIGDKVQVVARTGLYHEVRAVPWTPCFVVGIIL